MLKHRLIHPAINRALGTAGHHAKILIADGNYPVSSRRGPNSELVSLNLAPGIVTVKQVFEVLLTAIPVDAVYTMGIPADDDYARLGEPPVWSEFRAVLRGADSPVELRSIQKWDFYKEVESVDHVLTIQTGDQALWANLLVAVGCRTS